MAFIGLGLGAVNEARADTKAEVCERLADVLRTGVDQIVAGDHTIRVLIALDAHERLGCDINEVLTALNLRKLDQEEAGRIPVKSQSE